MTPVQTDPLAAAISVAAEHGVSVTRSRLLAQGAAVVAALEPASLVVKVARSGLARELAVVTWLHARGLPVASPAGVIPTTVHQRHGWEMTFWEQLDDTPGDPRIAGAALRAIDDPS